MSAGRSARRSSLSAWNRLLTKEQILELYLNQIFLGRNAYGVQAASSAYFDKDVDDLASTRPPISRSCPRPRPITIRYGPPERALGRRNYVLREMHPQRLHNQAQWDSAAATPLGTIRYGSGEHFRDMGGYYMEEVRRELLRRFGETAEDGPNSVYAGGLWVRTSVIPEMQEAAANALREGLARFDGGRGWRDLELSIDVSKATGRVCSTGLRSERAFPTGARRSSCPSPAIRRKSAFPTARPALCRPRRFTAEARRRRLRLQQSAPGMIIVVKDEGGGRYVLRSIPEMSGGMLAQEVHTGRIVAMQGGFDVIGSSYNRATQALRQSGLGVQADRLPGGSRERDDSGFDHRRFAFLRLAGRGPWQQMLQQLRPPLRRPQDAALGSRAVAQPDDDPGGVGGRHGEDQRHCAQARRRRLSQLSFDRARARATRPLQGWSTPMRSSPTTAARWNRRRSTMCRTATARCCTGPTTAARSWQGCNAADWNGGAMPRPPARTRQLIDPMSAFQMVHVLEGVVERGTATVLRDLDRPLFGKTGTTSGPTNVWFVGGTPDIVAGVYVGYDQPRPMGHAAQGGRIAAPIFKEWAQAALKDQPKTPFVAPPGSAGSGSTGAAAGACSAPSRPRPMPRSQVIWEAFRPQTEPRRSFRRADEREAERMARREASGPPRRCGPTQSAAGISGSGPVEIYRSEPAPLQTTTAAQ
jgi:penicillin-binding protein 1A